MYKYIYFKCTYIQGLNYILVHKIHKYNAIIKFILVDPSGSYGTRRIDSNEIVLVLYQH